MRTFKKTYLPDSIDYKGKVLKLDAAKSATVTLAGGSKKIAAIYMSEIQGRTVCLVEVTNTKLKDKIDLHCNYYSPSVFIFSDHIK